MRYPLVLALVTAPVTMLAAQTLGARVDSVMRVAESQGFSGVIRVDKDGTLLIEKAYGLANRAEHLPFTPATIVQIGSNTKDFTAVAVLQLVEAGRVRLSDSLGRYFPGAPADKKDITVRQLLNHRAGFPQGIGADFEPIDKDAFLARAMTTELLFAPGSRESYSNTGFSLLAAIIEHVSGKTYDHYVQDAILTPLGLTRTGFLLPGFTPSELAHGYSSGGRDEGVMLAKGHAPDGPYWNLRGNGGMLSTLDDMHAFYAALFGSEKLLKAATRNPRFNPDEPIGLAGSDGINFFLYDRFPMRGTEILIASTNAAMKAPAIRRQLGAVLDLPSPDEEPHGIVARPGGTPVPEAAATVIREFIAALNAGDRVALRSFIAAHFVSGGDAPSVDERTERLSRMHENLGTASIERMETYADGSTDVTTRTGEGPTLIKVMMDLEAPYRIHSLQILLGG